MAESATTTTSTSSSTGASSTAGSNGAAEINPNPGGKANPQGGKAQANLQGKNGAATQAPPAAAVQAAIEEFEEIKLGSISGKVPKALAKAVKDLERGFHSKSQENAGFMRAMEAAKTNPDIRDALLNRMGIDKYEFAEMTLAEKLEQLSLSPEQKRLRELEDYKSKSDKEKAEIEAQRQRQEFQTKVQASQQQYNKTFVEAWQNSGLPPDPVFAQMLAAEMVAANSRQENLSWKDAAAKLVVKVETLFPRILDSMDPERFERVLGQKSIDRIRELALRRVTQAAPTVNSGQRPDGKKPPVTNGSGSKAKTKFLSEREWDQAMRKRGGL